MSFVNYVKRVLKSDVARDLQDYLCNVHRPSENKHDLIVLSTPRSGSTWLTELLNTQPGFKICKEPFNLRRNRVRRRLGLFEWEELYDAASKDTVLHYLKALSEGSMKFKNPTPFVADHFRFFTNRIVFKLLHGCEHFVSYLNKHLQAHFVWLVRHPIPTTRSRDTYPRLEAFLNSSFRDQFSKSVLADVKSLIKDGTHFEKGIISWCLQNSALLNSKNNLLPVTYEQMVLDPEPVLDRFTDELQLPDPALMNRRLKTPSKSTTQSADETKKALQEYEQSKQWLVEKWTDQVSEREIKAANDLLHLFDIDVYRAEEPIPRADYWIS